MTSKTDLESSTDLLLYDELSLENDDLVPHPRILDCDFVLLPCST